MKQDDTMLDMITAQLRETEPTIADGGFTVAVTVRSSGLPAWKKNTILLIATTLGSAIVASKVPATFVPDLLNTVASDWMVTFGAAAVMVYGSAMAALWTARRY